MYRLLLCLLLGLVVASTPICIEAQQSGAKSRTSVLKNTPAVGPDARDLTPSEQSLVAGSKKAIIETGITESYFLEHFKLLQVIDKPADRRRRHFLGVNSTGYSLPLYPAGNGTNATGDATFAVGIPDNVGIALFNTATPANFSTATRLDAVGSSSEANTLYKEGTGYAALPFLGLDSAFVRDMCGKGGSTTSFGSCPTAGFPKDTDNNASDFVYTNTNGTDAGAGARIGAAGPKNLSSPIQRNSTTPGFLLDSTVDSTLPPNRVRDTTPDPGNNSTFGTMDIRRRFTNNTGSTVTRLRFRVVDMSVFPVPVGVADLRARTGLAILNVAVSDPATCAPAGAPCMVTVQGTTLEAPPPQPNGGGFNSSVSADIITLGTPLAPGASINVHFLLGVQQTGNFKFFLNIEALP